jgi:alkanesulfonate monooxygenase SsuD/methylene tetrahydromethanopterin reductase-like flavin-dependent oxidoreductase (luciferase family)
LRVGIFIGDATSHRTTVEELLANARWAEEHGLATGWVPHIPWSLDGLVALALAGQVTSRIELGTAVMPTYPRHPLAMAQQALSTQAACNGRLALGIGPSHPVVIERMHGLAYERPIRHLSEYVAILDAASAGPGMVKFDGELYHVDALLDVPGATPVPVLVAALAPQMLRLAGRGGPAPAAGGRGPAHRHLRRRRRRPRGGGRRLRRVHGHPDLPADPGARRRRGSGRRGRDRR